jgi:hypothetical protein
MAPPNLQAFVERLERRGLTFQRDQRCVDIVVADQLMGPTAPCGWIDVGDHSAGFRVAWLSGTEPGEIRVPPGWSPEQSLSKEHHFIPNENADQRLVPLGEHESLETYLDTETGQVVHLGRAFPDEEP